MKYLALLGVLLVVVACASKKDQPGGYIDPGSSLGGQGGRARADAGTGGDASTGGDAATVGDADAPDAGPLAPIVTITSPVAVSDPNQGDVVTTAAVSVVCTAKASASPGAQGVLTSSVKIQMFGSDGKQIGKDGNVQATVNDGEYTTSFVLTDAPNGPVSFKCSATDKATPAHAGSATLGTFIDKGPTVALLDPVPGSAHPFKALAFSFSAVAAPLAAGDTGATVTAVTLKVNGVLIDGVSAVDAGPLGLYALSIDLTDPTVFSPPPTGPVPVRITATNQRGITNTQDYMFSVDSEGPVMAIVKPGPDTFVGGNATITFTATDAPAGVDTKTVAIKINTDDPVYFDPKNMWSQKGDTFTYTFNTKNYPLAQIQLTVNVVASDLAGNASLGASTILLVDNVPPIVDMFPPVVQERQLVTASQKYKCSEPFAPLGDDAPRDLETVPSVNVFRALIWDLGNAADGQGFSYFSGIKDSTVRLYFQSDPTKPIVKNLAGTPGGACDAIDDDTLRFHALVPIGVAGTAYYDALAPTDAAWCPITGNDAAPGARQCGGLSSLRRVIQHDLFASNPAIPVVYAIKGDTAQCTGNELDLTTEVTQNGWLCAAVIAEDTMGNVAVSAPLRLCLNSPAYAGPDAGDCSGPAPSCVRDNCVPSGHYPSQYVTRP